MVKRYKITVNGNVQGVGFRYHTRKMASFFLIKGFVKNLSNGDVYIEAEGENLGITEFIKWCHLGPDNAHVTKVNYIEGELKKYQHFEVRF